MGSHYDVIIAGGGAIGSACAWFLASNPSFGGSLAVIEPDPTYRYAASALSAGSIRQQFSSTVNIAMSRFGMEFLRSVPEVLARGGDRPDIGLVESTYLFLAGRDGLPTLKRNVETQRGCGVPVHLCSPSDLGQRFPWLNVDGLTAGAFTVSGEGWFDGYQLLMALRGKARELGAQYIESRVVNLVVDGERVSTAVLADGSHLFCDNFVDAAGTHAPGLAAQVGIEIPVFARKRCVYVFDAPAAIADCPLVIDPSGLWFRPEGRQFICGLPPVPDRDVAPDDFAVDHARFEQQIWPLLANRVSAFSALRPKRAWAGHYDYNAFDQNAIVGRHPKVQNFLLANGFSGHGLQHAPAIGRGLSELILFGAYRSLDLSPLSFERLGANRPLREQSVI